MRLFPAHIFSVLILLLGAASFAVHGATPIAHYRFDSCDLVSTGTATDSIGGHDGVISGGIGLDDSPTSGAKPETCTSAVFAGGAVEINGLPVSTVAGDKTSVSFWMYWDGTNSVMPLGWESHDLWFVDGYFGFNTGGGDIYGISSLGLANGWHHVAAIFTNGDVTGNALFIDGVSKTLTHLRGTINHSRAVVDPHLRLGGWWRTDGYRFSGHLDEVKVYNGAVTQAEIDADRSASTALCPVCPPPPPASLIARYKFDDDWDSSGILTDGFGGADGTVSGSISAIQAPASGLKPDTCTAGSFTGGAIDINGLPISTTIGDKTSLSFWMYWDGTNSVMPLGWESYDLWFVDGYFGFNTSGGDIYGISSAGLANGWHHVVAVFTNGNVYGNALYIDGVSQALTHRRGSINNNRAVVDSHLRIGGWWYNDSYRFRGALDSLKIYNGAVDQSQVNADMLEYGGCGLIGVWHMDETTWGTVVDSTANGFHGTANNGAHTDGASPAISGQNGSCRYGVFDGQDDYVSISTLPNLTGNFTIAAWIRAEELGNDQRIFADDRNNAGGFAFSLGDGGNGRLRFFSRNVSPVILDSAAVISQDTWHFVAVVHDVTAKSRKIYVDGATTPVAQDVYAGTWGSDNGDASIGGEVDGTSEGVSRWRFKGNIDEVVIYQRSLSGDEIAILKDQTHPCSAGVPDDASGFNCIVSGGDDLTGRLYTRIAGQSFTFDVSALKDSNGDGTADGRETDFAANEDRTLLVELVDGSGGGVCAAYPGLSPTVSQNLIFTNADQGRKVSSAFTVNSAYRQLRCRVTDTKPTIPVVGCSTDSFAVRPQQLQLQIPSLTNSGASGDPKQAAGTGFTLQATAINGYDGTPTIDNSRIESHSGAVQTGTLGGLFSAADPVSGTAEGNSFIYSEVGNFRFLTEGIVDTTFTWIDQPGDCIDDFSNTPDGSGRVGCNFANTSVSAWVGRFIPDHFTVTIDSSGALADTCAAGGFSYSGQAIEYAVGQAPTATITAWNGLGTSTVTQNYTGLYNHLQLSGINMPDTTADANQMGVDGVTPVVLGWGLGSAVINDQGDGTLQFIRSGDTFTYARGGNDQVAPFTAAVELEINAIADDDGVSAIGLPQLFQPTGVPVRFGRLALANAHGSELETLSVSLQVEYYDGSGNGFVTNTADLCTIGLTLSLSDLDATDGLLVTSGAGKETATYADAATAGGYSADDLSNPAWLFSQPPVAGDFNLNLQAPGTGNSGSAGVHVNAPAWLEYRWSGGAMSDPSSKATFGIFNRPSTIIYMRESY